jgi:hypothetical protein
MFPRLIICRITYPITCPITCLIVCCMAIAEEPPLKFRSDDNPDKNLPWHQPTKGEFPPEGSAHYISGELIKVDHTQRELVIRVDRNDSQQRGVWDLPLSLTMLPYGSIYYNGTHAALQNIPLGTHLHTWCYLKDPVDTRPPMATFHDRVSPEADFRQCLRIEDDFSYHARRDQSWRIDGIDLDEMKLTATLLAKGKPIGDAKIFDFTSSTVVYQGNGFSSLGSIQSGQETQLNLTWVTLYGPGRVIDIWLDQQSRELAVGRQLERHRNHIRQRGVPGWIDAVDDDKQTVTLTFFDGLDPTLFKDFGIIVTEPFGWPTSGGAKNDLEPKGTLAVARETLMTYDPINDRKGGNIIETNKFPIEPGSSGVQIVVECGLLLEGHRPGEVVRFYPACWDVVALPKEEQFFGRE